jgi:hypothetical protein
MSGAYGIKENQAAQADFSELAAELADPASGAVGWPPRRSPPTPLSAKSRPLFS